MVGTIRELTPLSGAGVLSMLPVDSKKLEFHPSAFPKIVTVSPFQMGSLNDIQQQQNSFQERMPKL